jgi:hypothetical protein
MSYVWRLSRPWYLAPKSVVEVSFQHSGALNYTIRAQIGLAGRMLAATQSTSQVPYAAAYVSKQLDYAALAYDESTERDLVNITTRAIDIDRIIARIGTYSILTSTGAVSMTDEANFGSERGMNIRIQTSRNSPIIRDYTNVRALFGHSRSMDVPFKLDPNEFLRVGVRNTIGPVLADPFSTYGTAAYVSILGSRQEAI